MPERLRHLHWVNYYTKEGYDRLLSALRIRAKVVQGEQKDRSVRFTNNTEQTIGTKPQANRFSQSSPRPKTGPLRPASKDSPLPQKTRVQKKRSASPYQKKNSQEHTDTPSTEKLGPLEIVSIILILCVMLGCSVVLYSSGLLPSIPVVTTTPSQARRISTITPTAATTSTTLELMRLFDFVPVGAPILANDVNMELTVLDVQHNIKSNKFPPTEGLEFMAISVQIENVGLISARGYSKQDFYLIDEDETIFLYPNSLMDNERRLEDAQVEPGNLVEGDLIFYVPMDYVPVTLVWKPTDSVKILFVTLQ